MRFKKWMEGEAPLGANTPDMLASIDPNRGSDTPASAEVKRTGLQPQVDAQEIKTKEKKDQDKILAIDGAIERFDKEVPQGEDEDTPKTNKFKKYLDELKAKWQDLKMDQDNASDENGLGNHQEDEYEKAMRDHPNAVPASGPMPTGAGIFGTS